MSSPQFILSHSESHSAMFVFGKETYHIRHELQERGYNFGEYYPYDVEVFIGRCATVVAPYAAIDKVPPKAGWRKQLKTREEIRNEISWISSKGYQFREIKSIYATKEAVENRFGYRTLPRSLAARRVERISFPPKPEPTFEEWLEGWEKPPEQPKPWVVAYSANAYLKADMLIEDSIDQFGTPNYAMTRLNDFFLQRKAHLRLSRQVAGRFSEWVKIAETKRPRKAQFPDLSDRKMIASSKVEAERRGGWWEFRIHITHEAYTGEMLHVRPMTHWDKDNTPLYPPMLAVLRRIELRSLNGGELLIGYMSPSAVVKAFMRFYFDAIKPGQVMRDDRGRYWRKLRTKTISEKRSLASYARKKKSGGSGDWYRGTNGRAGGRPRLTTEQVAERIAKINELRAQGLSHNAIATHLIMTPSGLTRFLERAKSPQP